MSDASLASACAGGLGLVDGAGGVCGANGVDGAGGAGGAGGASGVTVTSSVASLGVVISGVGSAVVASVSSAIVVVDTADASCVGSPGCSVGGVESFALVLAVGLEIVIVPTGPGVAFDFTEPMTDAGALMSLRIIPAALLGLVDELLREVPVKGTVLDCQSGTAFVGAGMMTVVPCIDCKRPVLFERPMQAVGLGKRTALIANPSEGLS